MPIRPELEVINYLGKPQETDIPPATLLEHQEIAAEVIKQRIFPLYYKVLLQTVQSGTPIPDAANPRLWSAAKVKKDKGYLSVSVHGLTKIQPLMVKDQQIGTETGQIFVSDGIDSITFHLGNDNQVVFDNDNIPGAQALLKDAPSIFNPVVERNTFRKGAYPALWIGLMDQSNILEEISEDLQNKPGLKLV